VTESAGDAAEDSGPAFGAFAAAFSVCERHNQNRTASRNRTQATDERRGRTGMAGHDETRSSTHKPSFFAFPHTKGEPGGVRLVEHLPPHGPLF
jgi:hypothetical protein